MHLNLPVCGCCTGLIHLLCQSWLTSIRWRMPGSLVGKGNGNGRTCEEINEKTHLQMFEWINKCDYEVRNYIISYSYRDFQSRSRILLEVNDRWVFALLTLAASVNGGASRGAESLVFLGIRPPEYVLPSDSRHYRIRSHRHPIINTRAQSQPLPNWHNS